MAARRPTIDDVAKAAGVSPTTASSALNGTGRVQAGTRERVRRVAAGLGYRANRTARGLRLGRAYSLGLMLPHGGAFASSEDFFGIDFYLELAVGAAQVAFSHRHGLTLLPDVVGDELRQFPLDGVIVNDPPVGDPRLLALDELGLPYVTIDRALDRPEHRRWVATDTIAGTRGALDQLAEAGASRIALLSSRLTWAWLADTETAYRAWCADRGAEPLVVDIDPGGPGRKPQPLALPDDLFGGSGAPDAIFTAPERHAVAAARAIVDRGLRVGEDVLLACGVDSHQAREHTPPITALDLHPHAQAEAAVELMLGGDLRPEPRILTPTLRARASSRGRA